jgi:hypothetical protein
MNLSFATVLLAAIVASLIAMPVPARSPAKIATTVLAKADRLASPQARPLCSQQNWPNFDAVCLRYTDDRQAVGGIRAVGDQS